MDIELWVKMADNNLVISELLCFATKKYGNHENNGTKVVISSFYSSHDIVVAKELIFKSSEEMNTDGLPRLVTRRNTDNKARLDVDDIFMLMEALDEKNLLIKLPKFVAHDPAKLPPFKTSDLDMCLLALRVAALEDQLSNVVSKCIDHTFGSSGVGNTSKIVNEVIVGFPAETADGRQRDSASVLVEEPSRERPVTSISSTWSDLAKECSDDDFVIVKRRRPITPTKSAGKGPPRRSLRGTKSTSSDDLGPARVAAVPRRCTAFVGRLSLDTTEKDLCDLMTSAGMQEARCRRLVSKEGQSYKTAAFMVSCSVVSEADFYDESNWPIGCELRDWYFKNKS
jgi:hypothetical protein